MHEFSVAARRFLDGVTALFALLAAVSLDQVATTFTIGASIVSIICGGIRIQEYRAKRAAARRAAP